MIVDDEPDFRELLAEIVNRQGFFALVAASGPEALSLLEDNPQDVRLAILDYAMPRMDGLSLAQELQRRRPGIQIALLSGYADSSGEPPKASADFVWLTKPLQFDRLEELLNSL